MKYDAINQMIGAVLAKDPRMMVAENSFKPIPDRRMLGGQTYENVPYETLSPKNGDFTTLYRAEDEANDAMHGQKHVHTYEPDGNDTAIRLWRLKEFLGM